MQVLVLLLTQVMELMMMKLSKITRVSESPPASFHENPADNASEHATNQSSCSSDEEGIDNVDGDVNTQVNVSVFPNGDCTCRGYTDLRHCSISHQTRDGR